MYELFAERYYNLTVIKNLHSRSKVLRCLVSYEDQPTPSEKQQGDSRPLSYSGQL